jgi:hypothetical protein
MYGFTLAVHVTFPQFPHFMILRSIYFFFLGNSCPLPCGEALSRNARDADRASVEFHLYQPLGQLEANSQPTEGSKGPEMSRDVQRCPDPEEIDPQKSKHSGIAKSSTMCSFCSGFSSNVEL